MIKIDISIGTNTLDHTYSCPSAIIIVVNRVNIGKSAKNLGNLVIIIKTQ